MINLPGHFVFELTRRCNHNCLHCDTVWGSPELGYPPEQAELSSSQTIAAIARLQSQVPLRSIGLSGGEPLLKEGLPQIVDFISSQDIDLIIITNGSLLTANMISRLGLNKSNKSNIVYEIPLLSFKKEVHDRLSGKTGAWDGATNALVDVAKAEETPVAAFVATKLNHKDLFKTGELAIALGADALMYNRINLAAHNFPYVEQLMPSPAMIREDLEALEALNQAYGLPVSVSVVIEPCIVDMSSYSHLKFVGCPLCGEDSYFTIDPSGYIRICNHSPEILGNILADDFPEIFYKNKHVCNYRECLPDECVSCIHPLKDKCNGGCRAAAEQCYGTIEKVDPFVKLSNL